MQVTNELVVHHDSPSKDETNSDLRPQVSGVIFQQPSPVNNPATDATTSWADDEPTETRKQRLPPIPPKQRPSRERLVDADAKPPLIGSLESPEQLASHYQVGPYRTALR